MHMGYKIRKKYFLSVVYLKSMKGMMDYPLRFLGFLVKSEMILQSFRFGVLGWQ